MASGHERSCNTHLWAQPSSPKKPTYNSYCSTELYHVKKIQRAVELAQKDENKL